MLRSRQRSGCKFRRQHPLNKYILDFYCNEAHPVIEIDGGQHSDDQHRKRDNLRTVVIKEKAIRVIRFWNDDVLNNLDDVIAEMDATLADIMTNKNCDY